MAERNCAIPECLKPAGVIGSARGWCREHYRRWQRHGDPLGGRPYYGYPANLWAQCDRSGGNEACWPWTGYITPHGYGQTYEPAGRAQAHVAMYRHLVGEVPDGYEVDHLCHSRSFDCNGGSTCRHRRCINPAHLEPVSKAENRRRQGASKHRRTRCARGHPRTEANVYVAKDDGAKRCRVCANEANRKRKRCAS